jgi:hypothetical protein
MTDQAETLQEKIVRMANVSHYSLRAILYELSNEGHSVKGTLYGVAGIAGHVPSIPQSVRDVAEATRMGRVYPRRVALSGGQVTELDLHVESGDLTRIKVTEDGYIVNLTGLPDDKFVGFLTRNLIERQEGEDGI